MITNQKMERAFETYRRSAKNISKVKQSYTAFCEYKKNLSINKQVNFS